MELFSFITMFFVSKKISILTAFVCWPPEKSIALWQRAAAGGVRLRLFSELRRRLPELPAYDVPREGVLLDLDCPHAHSVLLKASSSRAFIHRYSWLLLQDSLLNASGVADRLADVDVLPDADVTWSSLDASVDVYKVKEGQPLVVTPVGLERNHGLEDMELLWSRWPTPVARRKDLNNVYFKSATVITQPEHFKGWSDLTNRQIDTFPKLTYPLMMLLAEDLHFRYDMRQVSAYGEERNGSFDGVAGLLQRGEVDLGLASMFLRGDRSRVLHYSAETLQLKGAFMFRQPAQSAVWNVFSLPFSGGVWAALAGVAALAALALAAAARATSVPHLTLAECCTFAIGTICQQGGSSSPAAAAVRVAMLSSLGSAVFVYTAYSARVVCLLQTPSAALRSLDQLARSPLALAVQDTTYKRVYFAESRDPATQRLYRRKLLPQGEAAYLSVVDGVAKVRTGLFAFQVEQSAGYEIISKTFTEAEKCGLQEVEAFRLPAVAVPLRRHAGLRDLVAARLRWQREVGLMSAARRRWLAARPRCAPGGGAFRSVALADVLPALQVLGAGAAVATALLALELAVSTVTNRHSPRAASQPTLTIKPDVEKV